MSLILIGDQDWVEEWMDELLEEDSGSYVSNEDFRW